MGKSYWLYLSYNKVSYDWYNVIPVANHFRRKFTNIPTISLAIL